MPVYKSDSPTLKNESWYFRTYYIDLEGNKKQYKSKKFLTRKEALENERFFHISLKQEINSKDLTMLDLFNNYDQFKKDKVKITTYQNFHKMFKLLKPLEKVKVKDFSISHFNQWKDNINKSLSTRYKNNIYKFLRSVLNYGDKYLDTKKHNILSKMTNFTNPNELKKDMLFWTYEEFLKFIDIEKDIVFKTFFEVLYYCGLRQGEAIGLTWKDIDFRKRELSVNRTVTTKIKGERYTVLNPKTNSSIRTLPIPSKLYESLKLLEKESNKCYNYNINYFIFGGEFPLSATTIHKRKNDNCRKADVKQIRIHDFRHSTASLLINNGANINLVAKYLGHSNITTTLNIYSHLFQNNLDSIIKVIDNL